MLRSELEVAAQGLQGQVVVEGDAGVREEPFPVWCPGDAGQFDDAALAELVVEVGVDDGAPGLLDETARFPRSSRLVTSSY